MSIHVKLQIFLLTSNTRKLVILSTKARCLGQPGSEARRNSSLVVFPGFGRGFLVSIRAHQLRRANPTARLIYQHLRKMKEPVLSADLVRRRYTGWTNFDAVIAASGGWLQSDGVRGTVRALSREERQ